MFSKTFGKEPAFGAQVPMPPGFESPSIVSSDKKASTVWWMHFYLVERRGFEGAGHFGESENR